MTENMPKTWRERAAEEAAAKPATAPTFSTFTPPVPLPAPVAVPEPEFDDVDDDDDDEDDTDN